MAHVRCAIGIPLLLGVALATFAMCVWGGQTCNPVSLLDVGHANRTVTSHLTLTTDSQELLCVLERHVISQPASPVVMCTQSASWSQRYPDGESTCHGKER